jgi:hypothetical protein
MSVVCHLVCQGMLEAVDKELIRKGAKGKVRSSSSSSSSSSNSRFLFSLCQLEHLQ